MTEEQFREASHIKHHIGRINTIVKILDKKHLGMTDISDLGSSLYDLYNYSKDVKVKSVINDAITDILQYYESKFDLI